MSFRTRAIDNSRHNCRGIEWKQWIRLPERNRCRWLSIKRWKPAAHSWAPGCPQELLLLCDDPAPRSRIFIEETKDAVRIPQRLYRSPSFQESLRCWIGLFEGPKGNQRDLTPFILSFHLLRHPENPGKLVPAVAAKGSGLEASAQDAGTTPVQIPMRSSVEGLHLDAVGFLRMCEVFRAWASQVDS